MKELEWIKELEEDYKSGDKERFPEKEISDLPKGYKKGIDLYGREAEHRSAYRGKALYRLAYCYKYACGANKDTPKAFKMFEALAKIDCSKVQLPEDAGFTDYANISLADCYYRGTGTQKDVDKAIEIWQEYAVKADCTALNNLAVEYLSGKHLKKDNNKAFDLFMWAYLYGNISAINNLGWCYEKGYGTEKDIAKAVEYYREAANYGNVVAKNNLKRLKTKGIITENGDD